jgi:hypothetical protein
VRTYERTTEIPSALATELIARASRRPVEELRDQPFQTWRFRPALAGYDRVELGGGRRDGLYLVRVDARSDTDPDVIPWVLFERLRRFRPLTLDL